MALAKASTDITQSAGKQVAVAHDCAITTADITAC
jgi:hypothetical protein